jgi:hypothetical protein
MDSSSGGGSQLLEGLLRRPPPPFYSAFYYRRLKICRVQLYISTPWPPYKASTKICKLISMRCITSNDGTRYIRPNYRPARGPKPMGGSLSSKKKWPWHKSLNAELAAHPQRPPNDQYVLQQLFNYYYRHTMFQRVELLLVPLHCLPKQGNDERRAGGQGELAVPCGGSHKLWPYQCTWELVTTALL